MPDASAMNSSKVEAVDRAASVLRLFIDAKTPSLGITEISAVLSLSKAVVYRVLSTLRESGFVEVDDSRRYMLGPTSLALGLAYLSRHDLRERARPFLVALSKETQETATLSTRRADFRTYIDQVTPPREVKMTVAIGQSYPLHAGSSSKAFLAFLPEEDQNVYLRDHNLSPLTDLTITDPAELRRELAKIRKRGFARSLGERQPGSASVAAPVFNHEGEPVGVISICGPRERFQMRMSDASRVLLSTTRELSERLGFR